MPGRLFERRDLLRGGIGLAAAATGGLALSSCTTSDPGANVPPPPSVEVSSLLPNYVPFDGPAPDLPGTEDGVMPGFNSYPSSLVDTVPEPPGSGGEVTLMGMASAAAVPEESSNQVWQAWNDKLNVQLKFNSVVASEYDAKLNTMLAGDDLADITQIKGVSRLPEVFAAKFEDLTDFLAGDAIEEYPNLAAIPEYIWENCYYNGRLYTFPASRGIVGFEMMFRKDLLAEMGLPTEISSGEDFRTLCRELTDPGKNRHVFTTSPMVVAQFLQEMLGAPYEWKEDGGVFTYEWEAPESKEAIAILTEMWDEGVFHPDAFAGTRNPLNDFVGGIGVFAYYSYAVWQFFLRQGEAQKIDGFDVGAFLPVKYDGGGLAVKHLRNPVNTFSAMRKQDSPDRVKELLQVMNFFAAPTGSTESLLLGFGIEGRNFTFVDGEPKRTEEHPNESLLPYSYLISSTPELYDNNMESLQAQYDYQVTTIPVGIKDPTAPLYSPTASGEGVTLGADLRAGLADIIQGRKDMSEYDSLVQEWRDRGGEKIANEYAESLEMAN